MNNYYLHLERYSDGSLLHIGLCDDDEQVKLFDSTKYDDNFKLGTELILFVTKDITRDANIYFHNYKDDRELINDYIRVNGVIIKPDDNSDKDKGNNSGKPTVFLYDSRKLIDQDLKDFDEQFNLDIKNDIIINNNFFTVDTYNKTVPISVYTVGLEESQINNLSSYVDDKQTEIKNTVDLSKQPIIIDETKITIYPIQVVEDIEPTQDFYINKENLILASQPNDENLKFNPTNLIIESTSINTKLLKRGLGLIL